MRQRKNFLGEKYSQYAANTFVVNRKIFPLFLTGFILNSGFSTFCAIFRYLFCLQVKRDMAQGHLQCNDNTAALMASYIVQGNICDSLKKNLKYELVSVLNSVNWRFYLIMRLRFIVRRDENVKRQKICALYCSFAEKSVLRLPSLIHPLSGFFFQNFNFL